MGFGTSSMSSLKRKKDGSYSNSTKSCTVNVDENGRVISAYSYAQKMAYVDHDYGYILFNDEKFSVTTSSHQHVLSRLLEELMPKYKFFYIRVSSLNSFDGKTLDSLKGYIKESSRDLEYSEGLKEFAEFRFKTHKQFLSKVKKEHEERVKIDSERKSLQAKNSLLEKKLKELDYSNEANLIKALNTYKEINNKSWRIKFSISDRLDFEKVSSFIKYIKNNSDIIDIQEWVKASITNLRYSPEILNQVIQWYDYERPLRLNSWLSNDDRLNQYTSFLLENKDRFDTEYNQDIFNKIIALETFGSLGNEAV